MGRVGRGRGGTITRQTYTEKLTLRFPYSGSLPSCPCRLIPFGNAGRVREARVRVRRLLGGSRRRWLHQELLGAGHRNNLDDFGFGLWKGDNENAYELDDSCEDPGSIFSS